VKLRAIGVIRSPLRALADAPRQGSEGAPDAWLELEPAYADALLGIAPGDDVVVITWLHRADRNILQVHPRNEPQNPLAGVFVTRSPDRPNPIGLHEVDVVEIDDTRIRVRNLEAVHGTPIVDIKPLLGPINER
jgi:tRNA-Thr(GGU) m(6)t(6)A37 methyltransferase TsaA